jgi:pyruvate dehydrogenase E1 component
MLAGLEEIRQRRRSTYLRLTSKRVDQGLFHMPQEAEAREKLRKQVLAGAYRLIDHSRADDYRPGENALHLMATGAMIPEAVEASRRLAEEGVYANVINVTGPGPLYRRFQSEVELAMHAESPDERFMAGVIADDERGLPVVTVADGHPHSLAWIGGALGTTVLPLGVSEFGQSGDRFALYREYEIDVESIMAACFAALEQ